MVIKARRAQNCMQHAEKLEAMFGTEYWYNALVVSCLANRHIIQCHHLYDIMRNRELTSYVAKNLSLLKLIKIVY